VQIVKREAEDVNRARLGLGGTGARCVLRGAHQGAQGAHAAEHDALAI
jgi:hypothetical protein